MRRYKISDSMGTFMDGITFNGESEQSLYAKLSADFIEHLKEKKIPFRYEECEFKSGGFFGSVCRGLVVSHPNPPSPFFDLGFVIISNSLYFYYFGESRQVYLKNRHEALKKEGKLIKTKFFKPDEIILAQEAQWNQSVIHAFEEMIQ